MKRFNTKQVLHNVFLNISRFTCNCEVDMKSSDEKAQQQNSAGKFVLMKPSEEKNREYSTVTRTSPGPSRINKINYP